LKRFKILCFIDFDLLSYPKSYPGPNKRGAILSQYSEKIKEHLAKETTFFEAIKKKNPG